jgi:hypothetical protein
MLGRRDPHSAVSDMLSEVEAGLSGGLEAVGDRLESYGWWCIFGSNIALQHLTGRELQQAMRSFNARALEVAERLDNWAMRERVFTLQYSLHRSLVDTTGLELSFTIDPAERTLITGAMGRFPSFRALGWEILENAQLVENKQEVL